MKDGEHWFLLDDKGRMQTGWVQLKGKWYYLEANGAMRTGWLSYQGDDYFLTDTGAMAVGLCQTRLMVGARSLVKTASLSVVG